MTVETMRWAPYRDTLPRDQLVKESFEHLLRSFYAEAEDKPEYATYERGVFTGYLIGFGVDGDDALLVAEGTTFAECLDWDDAQRRVERLHFNADRNGVLFACGVLWGFKQGTSERRDANECAWCQRRICTEADTEYLSCSGTYLCDGNRDCFVAWHDDNAPVCRSCDYPN